MTELFARRAFPAAYIGLGLLFLVLFAGILPWKHRYLTVLVGFFAGILYFLVNDGIFYLVCDPRTISPGNSLFWVAGLDVHALRLHKFRLDLATAIMAIRLGSRTAYWRHPLGGLHPGGKAAAPDRQFPAGNQPGLPDLFAIYIAVTGRFTEQLHRRPEKLTFRDRLREYHHKEENP